MVARQSTIIVRPTVTDYQATKLLFSLLVAGTGDALFGQLQS